jgi:L-threonylcarbamoyladenylate synthase
MKSESANTVKIISPDAAGIKMAVAALAAGKLISFPTETVYGLGADATNDRAVAAIFAAKGRPQFNPLIVHLPHLEAVTKIAELDGVALKLARAFWPGPFTLVLKRRSDCGISLLVSAGLDTIAVRVPQHAVAHELLSLFNKPVAAPSANISGRLSPTKAEHVAQDLGTRIEMVLDGGACAAGLESTIVRVGDGRIDLLRPGSITPAQIEAVAGLPVIQLEESENPSAPGQLKSHYAPRAGLRLNALGPHRGEAFLAFGATAPQSVKTLNLSQKADLAEAAAHLFAYLRALDISGAAVIAVAAIPEEGLGLAINDRLRRAAAPRPSRNIHPSHDEVTHEQA